MQHHGYGVLPQPFQTDPEVVSTPRQADLAGSHFRAVVADDVGAFAGIFHPFKDDIACRSLTRQCRKTFLGWGDTRHGSV